jgi:hypothetical protein
LVISSIAWCAIPTFAGSGQFGHVAALTQGFHQITRPTKAERDDCALKTPVGRFEERLRAAALRGGGARSLGDRRQGTLGSRRTFGEHLSRLRTGHVPKNMA